LSFPELPVPRISFPVRVRAAWARICLATRGVRLSAASGRRLAAVLAVTQESARPAATEAARDQIRHRRAHEGATGVSGLSEWVRARTVARVDHLREALAQAQEETSRLEASLPGGAIPERPGVAVAALLGVAMIAEGWLTYTALAQVAPEQTVPLLLSSIVAAPLAALLAHRAGAMARRCAWAGRLRWFDAGAIAASAAGPMVLGLGIVASRVHGIPAHDQRGLLAAIAVGAGLQACLLGVPAISGWLGADPVPGLSTARRRAGQLTASLARAVRTLQERAEADRRNAARLDARLAESLAALEYWVAVYAYTQHPVSLPNRPTPNRPPVAIDTGDRMAGGAWR
jgi:hypothetical protein